MAVCDREFRKCFVFIIPSYGQVHFGNWIVGWGYSGGSLRFLTITKRSDKNRALAVFFNQIVEKIIRNEELVYLIQARWSGTSWPSVSHRLTLGGEGKGKPKINNSYFIIYRRGQELKNAVFFLVALAKKETNITWIEETSSIEPAMKF